MDVRPSSIPTAPVAIGNTRRTSPGFHIGSPSLPVIPSDGFSSPHDAAHTPPGVLTKIETITVHQKAILTVPIPMRNSCICCNRDNCICKKCTLERLKFYARRERLAKVLREKANLSNQIESILGETSQIAAETNNVQANIYRLKQEIECRKASIQMKEDEIKKAKETISRMKKTGKRLTESIEKHNINEKHMEGRLERRVVSHKDRMGQLDDVRRKLGLNLLLTLFPVKELIAENVVPEIPTTSNDTRWALINSATPMDDGRTFQIREATISENSLRKLSEGLSVSPLGLASELRRPFAALVHSVQLVNLLALIFDCALPYNISLKEICLCDRWTNSILDTDWHKLCQCVLTLGFRVGAENLHFHEPHSNLIEIARHLYDQKPIEQLHPVFANNHRMEIEATTAQLRTEKDLIDWDIIDNEFDM